MTFVPARLRLAGGAALIAALIFCGGCSSFRTELGRPLCCTAEGFTNGQTRLETVISRMGAPNAVTELPDGFAFLYEYSRVSEFQFGFSLNVSVLRYLKLLRARNMLEEQAMLVTFDNDGVMRSASMRWWKEDLGGGSAVQLIVSVQSLSDVSRFLRPADANFWGQRLLQSPPTALNDAQSLRTGKHGLQLRNVPEYAGQETLEMAKPPTEREKKKIKRNYQQAQ